MAEILQPYNQAIDYTPEQVYARDSQHPSPWQTSAFKLEQEFINGFSYPVTIVRRDNFKLTLPPEPHQKTTQFIIQVRLSIRNDVPLDTHALREQGDPGSLCLADAIEKGQVFLRANHRLYAIEYNIGRETLEQQGGCVYVRNLDIVASIRDRLYTPNHPLSQQGIHTQRLIEHPMANHTDTFGYGLKIVDKQRQYGERWVNINNAVYRVPVSVDPRMEDGVYLTTSGQQSGISAFSKPVTERFRFDQADAALRLYRSAELAQTHGDLLAEKEHTLKEQLLEHKRQEQLAKQQLLERQREVDERKHRYEQQRHREEVERKQTEARIAQLKDELAELDLKRNEALLNQRARYEQISYQRKETNEWIKFLPLIVTGVFSLVAAFLKR
jgi:hypothetical protein